MNISRFEQLNNLVFHSSLKNKGCDDLTKTYNSTSQIVKYSTDNIKANFVPMFGVSTSNFEMKNFLELLEITQVNGKSLLSQLPNRSFETDEDFDISEWDYFITLFDKKKVGEDKTYLEKFLSKTTFEDFFYSKEFSPTDVIELINDMRKPASYYDSKKLFEVIDLISDVDSSKYDEKERVQTLRYFLDLKDKNGKKIFEVSNPRNFKISTYRFLMNIDPASVDSSNLQMLLELVSNGGVGNHIFEFLPKNAKFSPNVVADIDKLYSAYINDEKPIDVFIPTYETKEKAQQELNIGDVFELDGEEKIYIKRTKDEVIQLKMTKEKYFELFPPIERFSTTQNLIGNCWEISVLQGIYANPQTRHILLSMFSQQGEDIIVNYPNGVCGDVLFENGKLPSEEDLYCYSQGAKGFQLLEYADGKEVQNSKIRKYRLHLVSLAITDPKLSTVKRTELEEMINCYGVENLKVEYDQNEKKWSIDVYEKTPYGYTTAEVLGRDGGSPLDLFVRLGFNNINEFILNEEDADEFLFNPENFKSNIVILTTKDIDFSFENVELEDKHAYLISGVEMDEKGGISSYKILNPWGMVEQNLTLEELKKYGVAITYANNQGEV